MIVARGKEQRLGALDIPGLVSTGLQAYQLFQGLKKTNAPSLAGIDFDLPGLLSTGLQTYTAIDASKTARSVASSQAATAKAAAKAEAARAETARAQIMAYAKPVAVVVGVGVGAYLLSKLLSKRGR